MNMQNDRNGLINRRHFLAGAAAAVVGASALGGSRAWAEETSGGSGKPNSVISGVRIGCITYSYRDSAKTAEQTLKALLEDGLSETELMDTPIRAYTGIGGENKKGPKGEFLAPKLSDEAMAKVREAELAKCVELRKMYNDAGVNIHIHKTPFGSSDADIEFNFQIAKALGCKAITTERNDKLAKKLAPFAEKHKIYVAFHNHTNNVPKIDEPDPLFEISPYIAFNLDIGHYVAGTKGKSPIPVIEKYHERIISLHLKDRTADGANLPWGQGQTPIKEVLQLLKKEQWPIYGDIELEYAIPKGSTSVAEVAKCVQYCREALA